MGVKFNTLPTDDPTIRSLQENIKAMAAAIPTSSTPVVATITKDYQVTGTEDVIHVDAQGGPVKITLKSPSSTSRPVVIKQVNLQGSKSKVNPVTIVSANGSKTIAGANSLALDDTGTGSVTLTSDDLQHWPTSGAGGNPPVPVPSPSPSTGLIYIGISPIKIVGNVISFEGSPTPPTVVPWVAPVPFGSQNTYISGSTGAEAWANEIPVDFTGAPAGITAYFWFEASDTASAGTVRIRIGATPYKDITAPVFVSVPITSATMTTYSVPVPITTPIGLNRVTLTTQSTNTNKLTVTGVNLLFR